MVTRSFHCIQVRSVHRIARELSLKRMRLLVGREHTGQCDKHEVWQQAVAACNMPFRTFQTPFTVVGRRKELAICRKEQRLAPGNADLREHGSQQKRENLKSVPHMHTHGMAHPASGSPRAICSDMSVSQLSWSCLLHHLHFTIASQLQSAGPVPAPLSNSTALLSQARGATQTQCLLGTSIWPIAALWPRQLLSHDIPQEPCGAHLGKQRRPRQSAGA